MSTYELTASQIVPLDLERAWAFFSDPRNLARITPPGFGFVIHTAEPTATSGSRIEYTVRPIAGIPIRWRTRIEDVQAPHAFTDVQESGPYAHWVHTHTLTAVDGGTRVDDRIEYRLPLGPLGRLAHRLVIRGQLEWIFRYRAAALRSILEPAPALGPGALTVAVVGGTGFVGSGIVRELRQRGHRVIAVSARGEVARGLLPDDVEIRSADVRTGDGLDAAVAGADAVVIALAFPGSPVERPRAGATFEAVDAAGTERVVAAAGAAGVTHVVYLSGAGAAPDARRHWFRAKWRAEEAVRGAGMAWTVVRPTWIFGPADVSLNRFLGFARYLPFVPLTSMGGQHLAPVLLDDVAAIVADALETPAARGQTFEVGGPEVLTMRDVVRRALRVAGLRRPVLPAPGALVKLAAWPMRVLPSPLLTPDAVEFINQPAVVDTAPLLAALPRRLTPFEEALAGYLAPSASPISIRTLGA